MKSAHRKPIAIAIALASMLVLSSFFSPHWTIHRMRKAIEARDYTAFASHVDFPVLRESFKGQLAPARGQPAEERPGIEGALEALGQGIAGAVAGSMVDAVVGTAGVIEMINQGVPSINRAVVKAALTQVPSAAAAIPDMEVKYRGWSRVAFRGADLPQEEGSFILRRDGLWSWRLAEVELPS